ncbi:MAG: hypothetical protein V4760_15860 [Bdellovibrionota bacterium]
MRTKAIVTIGSIYIAAALVAACASKPTESKNETPGAESSTKAAPTAADVKDRYTISQLDAAANALKVIADNSKDPKVDGGKEIIGCSMSAGKANAMKTPLRYLIEGRLSSEREAYSAAPSQYGDSNSFETCATNCSCGILSEVVRGARTTAFKKNDSKYHERWSARLKLKAKTLGERELRSCAVKQTWICGSELLVYLETQSAGI